MYVSVLCMSIQRGIVITMKRSQKVKKELNEQESLSRNGQFHSKTMKTRALQEDGIEGKITDMNIDDKFVYLGNKKNISLTSDVYQSQTYDSRTEIHESIDKMDDDILQVSYSIRYQPDVHLEIALDTGETGYISFSRLTHKEKDGVQFLNRVFNLSNKSFSNISENDITVIYNPDSNTGGKFILPHKDSPIKTKRRLYMKELGTTNDYEIIDSWFNYLHNCSYPKGWFKTCIKNVYTDGDEISLLVETPTNETLFKILFSRDSNSKFWNLVENIGHGDPSNIKGESIYIAPYYRTSMIDEFDYITRDVDREWVISTSDSTCENQKESYISQIKQKVSL